MLRHIALAALALTCAACDYSQSVVSIPDSRSMIMVQNAPDDAAILVDGKSVGLAKQLFQDNQALRLETGVHVITVTLAHQTLLSEKVFLGTNEVRTLTVPGKQP